MRDTIDIQLNDDYNLVDGQVVHRSGEPGVVDMNDYQDLACRTAGEHAWADPVYTALGLNEEAGEYAGSIKHEHYHGHPPDPDRKLKELGDIYWYLAAAARKQGFTLSEVATANIRKLATRYPEGFSTEASIERVDGEPMKREG